MPRLFPAATAALAAGLMAAGAVAAIAVSTASADSLWGAKSSGYFGDHRARQPGDLLTVLIVEDASGSNQATAQTSKENKFGATATGGSGLFSFLHPFSADPHTKNDFTGSGQADVSSKLNARLTVRVIKLDPNGNLVIQGARMVAVNHDQQELTLTATVRPEDVAADNTVPSTFLADAAIAYHGKGPNASAQRQGLFSRLLNWIF